MTLWLYRLIFLPALLLASPYYLWRMRRRGGYGRHFGDRFGRLERCPPRRTGVRRIWIQAVSVGELLAIGPLLERLAGEQSVEVVLTTTTSTGFRLAEERYHRFAALIGYFPIDAWWFSARAWRNLNPDLAVLAEGEWWPEHFAQARRRHVPIVSINARLSDRSFRRMRRLKGLLRALFGDVARILASSDQDRKRFIDVGFRADQVTTTGNLKLDMAVPEVDSNQLEHLRSSLGFLDGDFVLLGSSTWPGEEQALIETLRHLRNNGVASRLLLVPRHAERRGEIIPELERSGFTFHVRSMGACSGEVDIHLADTTGELRRLTPVADLVFVGKSLPPHGEGQTPIEAAAMGKPLVFGPVMSNFRIIARELVEAGAACVVADGRELLTVVEKLARDVSRRAEMAEAARRWHRANLGALDRTLDLLMKQLG
ncbi:MAG: 3-deoxy-D-manno-octulosonic acid transferase [Opitutaceae bacterium]|nr:3-deoxy-D-manno-octulosonic acid transferase [Opitutaceae bacterium]